MVTNDARSTREIKFRISIAKETFNMKRAVFTSTFKEEASKVLHLENRFAGCC
jgi:hypothetical protein